MENEQSQEIEEPKTDIEEEQLYVPSTFKTIQKNYKKSNKEIQELKEFISSIMINILNDEVGKLAVFLDEKLEKAFKLKSLFFHREIENMRAQIVHRAAFPSEKLDALVEQRFIELMSSQFQRELKMNIERNKKASLKKANPKKTTKKNKQTKKPKKSKKVAKK